MPNPYFLEGFTTTYPTMLTEHLFHTLCFDSDGIMRTVKGTPEDREISAKFIREGFINSGYTGIYAPKQKEYVVFDASAVLSVERVS